MLDNFTNPHLKGLKVQPSDTKDIKFLFLILQAINNLSGITSRTIPNTSFIVGTTTGGPVNGQNTWTITTLNLQGTTPLVLKNGTIQVNGTAYSFNNTTQVLTLLPSPATTFTTADVWDIIA